MQFKYKWGTKVNDYGIMIAILAGWRTVANYEPTRISTEKPTVRYCTSPAVENDIRKRLLLGWQCVVGDWGNSRWCNLGIEPDPKGLMPWYIPTSGFIWGLPARGQTWDGHISGHTGRGIWINSSSIMPLFEFISTKIHHGLNVKVFGDCTSCKGAWLIDH